MVEFVINVRGIMKGAADVRCSSTYRQHGDRGSTVVNPYPANVENIVSF